MDFGPDDANGMIGTGMQAFTDQGGNVRRDIVVLYCLLHGWNGRFEVVRNEAVRSSAVLMDLWVQNEDRKC